jgi:hypothetical protein
LSLKIVTLFSLKLTKMIKLSQWTKASQPH